MFRHIVIFFIILLILILEIDRNFIITFKLYNYYIRFFPKQIIFGIHNTIQRFREKKFIYDVTSLKLTLFLENSKKQLINDYIKFRNITEIYAHTTTDLLKKDFNYKYIFFKTLDKLYIDNCKKFSEINLLLKKFTNIKTCFLSIIYKQKIIPYHRGPYNGLLRYHFPLIIKPNTTYLEIMGKKIYYNKPFMFDDTYPHKLVKLDNSLRVILICDIENPYSLFHPHKLFY